MNNQTRARAPLRHSERACVLQAQIEGLITREGAGQFQPTKKALQLMQEEQKPVSQVPASAALERS